MPIISIKDLEEKPHDDRIYLIDKPNDDCYFFVWNGKLIFAVKAEPKKFIKYSTSLLEFNQSVQLAGVDDGEPLQCDFIIMKTIPSQQAMDTFVRLCKTYSNNNGEELERFFNTLVTLFNKNKEERSHVIGLFGELSVAKYFLENYSYNCEAFWQRDGNKSKYDFTLPNVNVEVKSSSGSPFSTNIKHDQIFNNDDVILATCSLENNTAGHTILELIEELKNDFNAFGELRTTLLLEERLLRIPLDEQNIHFSTKEIKFFNTSVINPFPCKPERISNLTYNLDIAGLPVLDAGSLIPR